MIKATLKSTGWRADEPKTNEYLIEEDQVAFDRLENNGTKTPVTFGELYNVYKDRKSYTKVDAGYEKTVLNVEMFENWFFKTYVPKGLYDRMISVKFEKVG